MLSILRGSFDFMLPCTLDSCGRCKLPSQPSGDMEKLSKTLQVAVKGRNLMDLLCLESRSDFAAYVRNVLRQADARELTLSPAGTWCQAPPIAQVLHSKVQGKERTFAASSIQAVKYITTVILNKRIICNCVLYLII